MKRAGYRVSDGRPKDSARILRYAKGLFTNNMAKIALGFGSNLVVAISVKSAAKDGLKMRCNMAMLFVDRP